MGVNNQGTAWNEVKTQVPLFPISARQPSLKYYAYAQAVSAVVGQAGTAFFSANGCYDPDITGTGHQPMGFDQMMLMYEQYVVVRSKITCTFTTDSIACRVAIYLSPDAVALTDPSRLVENGLLVSTFIDAAAASGGSGQRQKQLTASVDIRKYFGRGRGPRDIINDPDLNGGIASNPAEQVYFGVAVWDMNAAAAVGVFFDALIEYDTFFTEPKKLTTS